MGGVVLGKFPGPGRKVSPSPAGKLSPPVGTLKIRTFATV
jgi:hypothetical protein